MHSYTSVHDASSNLTIHVDHDNFQHFGSDYKVVTKCFFNYTPGRPRVSSTFCLIMRSSRGSCRACLIELEAPAIVPNEMGYFDYGASDCG